MSPLLGLAGLHKRFGGLTAVNNVSFAVPQGAIIGLIGPNGAGKTTVFNLVTGNIKPDSGEVIFQGRNVAGLPPHQIVELGIARTFQNIRLFPGLSALENVLAGRHCRMRAGLLACLFHLPAQRREEKKAVQRAMKELAFVGLEKQHDNLAKNLSYGSQRLLEIARALASDPRLLILDEPAGGMNDQETQDLMGLVRAIRDLGISVLLIEHDMNLVMKICDHLVVLEHGAVIARGAPAEIRQNPKVIEAYLGADNDF